MGGRFDNAAVFAMSAFEEAGKAGSGRYEQLCIMADCRRIFQRDLVLVKNPMSLVRCGENAGSVPVQFGGQVR